MRSKSKYDTSPRDSIQSLLKKLKLSRREDELYVTARLLGVIWQKISLSKAEKEKLKRQLDRARWGKVPLASWLPRGYQIARFLMLVKFHCPEVNCQPTGRDRILMFAAIEHYKNDKDDRRRSLRQLKSLTVTMNTLGVETIFWP